MPKISKDAFVFGVCAGTGMFWLTVVALFLTSDGSVYTLAGAIILLFLSPVLMAVNGFVLYLPFLAIRSKAPRDSRQRLLFIFAVSLFFTFLCALLYAPLAAFVASSNRYGLSPPFSVLLARDIHAVVDPSLLWLLLGWAGCCGGWVCWMVDRKMLRARGSAT